MRNQAWLVGVAVLTLLFWTMGEMAQAVEGEEIQAAVEQLRSEDPSLSEEEARELAEMAAGDVQAAAAGTQQPEAVAQTLEGSAAIGSVAGVGFGTQSSGGTPANLNLTDQEKALTLMQEVDSRAQALGQEGMTEAQIHEVIEAEYGERFREAFPGRGDWGEPGGEGRDYKGQGGGWEAIENPNVPMDFDSFRGTMEGSDHPYTEGAQGEREFLERGGEFQGEMEREFGGSLEHEFSIEREYPGAGGMERPEMEAPEVEQSEMERPEMEAPEVERPEMEAPEVERPEMEAPEVEHPEMEHPEMEAPEFERPAMEWGSGTPPSE